MNSKFYWQKDGVNITKRYKYRGTTTDTLTLLNATENDQGIYTLIVSMEAENQQLSVILSIGKSVSLVLYLHLHCLIIILHIQCSPCNYCDLHFNRASNWIAIQTDLQCDWS